MTNQTTGARHLMSTVTVTGPNNQESQDQLDMPYKGITSVYKCCLKIGGGQT
jgi:hypothetical protein